MKDPKELRDRAERYRGHARSIDDKDVSQVIRTVADNLEHQADRIEQAGRRKEEPEVQQG